MDFQKEILDNLKFLYRYRNSIIFDKEIFRNENEFFETMIDSKETFHTKTKELLHILLNLTKLNLDELKIFLKDKNYYNLIIYLYEVSSSLDNLIDKDNEFNNHILKLIQNNLEVFNNFNNEKFIKMLSIFSEITCINNITAGRKKFIISGDEFGFKYKKEGKFDLVLQNNKEKLFYFDVKRLTLDGYFNYLDDNKIQEKIKDKIMEIDEKGTKVDRPLFLILDCSDFSVCESYKDISSVENKEIYDLQWKGESIINNLKRFFDNNLEIMPELKNIGGINIFYWTSCIKKDKNDIFLLFRTTPFTNLKSKFSDENQELIEINNIISSELEKEHNQKLLKTIKIEMFGFNK